MSLYATFFRAASNSWKRRKDKHCDSGRSTAKIVGNAFFIRLPIHPTKTLSLSLVLSLSIYLSIFLPIIDFHEEMVRTHIEYCSQYFGVCACTVTGKVHQLERVALKDDASSPAQPPAYQPATVCPLKMFFLTIQRRIPFLRPMQGDHYIFDIAVFLKMFFFFLTL